VVNSVRRSTHPRYGCFCFSLNSLHCQRSNSGDCSSPPNPTMSVATMLQPASRQSRASSSSSSSFQPVARQNTMSSHDTRSLRQSKRMSVTALYLSMSAKDRDLEISDDLARGTSNYGLSPMVALILRQHKSTCGI
jgi:hypothetical protein